MIYILRTTFHAMDVMPKHQVGPNARTRMHTCYAMYFRARIYVTHPGLAHSGKRFTLKSVLEKLEHFEAS